ncbi:hypothetical protein E2C01_093068 [Portunus trituberculatus]|uniref:Uncharacterized protein n=1 Tax=Portunus trituberculatus TaxID=210409 RepID=A0A5B7JSC3_PORTR|nr:hypothetical protein [Portunus trituberculatus]
MKTVSARNTSPRGVHPSQGRINRVSRINNSSWVYSSGRIQAPFFSPPFSSFFVSALGLSAFPSLRSARRHNRVKP